MIDRFSCLLTAEGRGSRSLSSDTRVYPLFLVILGHFAGGRELHRYRIHQTGQRRSQVVEASHSWGWRAGTWLGCSGVLSLGCCLRNGCHSPWQGFWGCWALAGWSYSLPQAPGLWRWLRVGSHCQFILLPPTYTPVGQGNDGKYKGMKDKLTFYTKRNLLHQPSSALSLSLRQLRAIFILYI